ncbi:MULTISPECIES: lipoprotein [unclassified Nonomuraea]|uniref:lipoprotein n=1 Tax=unclassified Nonomuraea TaxID=2593643 RepID=UPI0034057171
MRKTIVLIGAAVVLSGCGMLPGGQPQTAAKEAGTTAPAPPQSAPQQTAPPQADVVIATRAAKVGSGGQYGEARVDITALKRQGRTVTLNWTITAVDGKVNVHNGLGGGVLDYTVSNVSLIDPVNAKRYRVARNGTGADATCVCSGTQGQFLEAGKSSTLYAVFAAPPPEVTKVNVEMPMLGVLTDVPLS